MPHPPVLKSSGGVAPARFVFTTSDLAAYEDQWISERFVSFKSERFQFQLLFRLRSIQAKMQATILFEQPREPVEPLEISSST